MAVGRAGAGHATERARALPCCAAPPIQNLEAVSVGVLMTNSPPASSYTAVVSMPITLDPWPSSVMLRPRAAAEKLTHNREPAGCMPASTMQLQRYDTWPSSVMLRPGACSSCSEQAHSMSPSTACRPSPWCDNVDGRTL